MSTTPMTPSELAERLAGRNSTAGVDGTSFFASIYVTTGIGVTVDVPLKPTHDDHPSVDVVVPRINLGVRDARDVAAALDQLADAMLDAYRTVHGLARRANDIVTEEEHARRMKATIDLLMATGLRCIGGPGAEEKAAAYDRGEGKS